jgi:hypothetical protein
LIARSTACGIAWGLVWSILGGSTGEAQGPAGPNLGPYDIRLFSTPAAPAVSGSARLVFASSPFGVAVTADGHAIYNVRVTAAHLPAPASLGPYATYVAWAVTTDLAHWVRLGAVANGTSTVGPVDLDKFLVVVSPESSLVAEHAGPTVLHGTSPSGWLQTFLTHPLFRGIPD